MDRVVPRGQRPIERPVASRAESVYRPVQPQPADEETQPAQRPSAPRHEVKEVKSKKRRMSPLVVAGVIAALGLGGWFTWTKVQAYDPTIDSSKYQAVFFTNGQVYFGKLQRINDEYMKLTYIFYLQSQDGQEANKKTATSQSSSQLIKLGNEVHGPEDAMIIGRAQVLHYENLKSDGKVAKTIAQYKK